MNYADVKEVVGRLSMVEQQAFLNYVTRHNPNLRGAPIEDVVDLMNERDAYLQRREPFWEDHGHDLVTAGYGHDAINAATILAAVIATKDDDVAPLVRRLLRVPWVLA